MQVDSDANEKSKPDEGERDGVDDDTGREGGVGLVGEGDICEGFGPDRFDGWHTIDTISEV